MITTTVTGVRSVTPTTSDILQKPKRPKVTWVVEHGASRNYRRLGKALRRANPTLFRHGEYGDGLVQVLPNGEAPIISKAADLAPLIVDHVVLRVQKNGKVTSELPTVIHMNSLLRSQDFLSKFPPVEQVTRRPVYRDDFSLTEPGYDSLERLYYTGQAPEVHDSADAVNAFLGVMAFDSNADRTNAVAAALTAQLNRHWPGEKPLVLITANKSHAGKGTVTDFVRGTLPKADILYESIDWPMLRQFQSQLAFDSQIGFVCFDNVRLDSAGGRGKCIRSAFIESFLMNPEVILAAPGAGDPIRLRNTFVVSINTNDGKLSPDLMNRALPIHLTPKGDVHDRVSPIGNPKLEFLPQQRDRIEGELRGMIRKWKEAGCPENDTTRHPMSRWAKTIGGILMVNGFQDFLANYATAKITDDPVREALGFLAAKLIAQPLKPIDWATHAVNEGLAKTLFSAADRDTDRGRERGIGVVLKNHLDETFTTVSGAKKLTVKLEGGNRRWTSGENPHVRYQFKLLASEDLPVDEQQR